MLKVKEELGWRGPRLRGGAGRGNPLLPRDTPTWIEVKLSQSDSFTMITTPHRSRLKINYSSLFTNTNLSAIFVSLVCDPRSYTIRVRVPHYPVYLGLLPFSLYLNHQCFLLSYLNLGSGGFRTSKGNFIMNWKTIRKVSEETGMSEESLRALKKKGQLREKIHWIKSPNGRILLNIVALEKWLVSGV
jgi:hypothetical protein